MLLTAEELIERFFGSSKKMSVHKLYRLAKKNRIPSIKLDGRVFFPEDQFHAWINSQSQTETQVTVIEPYGRLRVVHE